MTDGQTNRDTAIKGLEELIRSAKAIGKEVRFFCLGFSNGHDAQLLGQIARSSTDLGNFVYIDDSRGAQKYEDMKNEIGLIFDLVPGDNSFKATLSNGKQVRLIKKDDGTFEATFNLLEQDFKDGFKFTNEEGVEFNVEIEEVESLNESDDIVRFINFQIFDYIEKLTQNPNAEQTEAIKKEISEIDQKLNEVFAKIFPQRIPKEEKEKLLSGIKSCKDNILNILGTIRQLQMGKLDNDAIARLNQLAYSGVRSANMNKKIAQRVDQNMEKFKEGDKKIKDYVSKVDLKKI